MSKIEDALNKIKTSNNSGLTVVSSSNNLKNISQNSNELTVVRSNMVNHSSSVREIALMKNNKIMAYEDLSESKIIFPDMPGKKIIDSYRDLRTKLIQESNGRNMSVMLTSCVPDYYSTMTAVNLAAAFSLDASKTSLLIDCNLNNPQLDKKLQLVGDKGLTDYLEDDVVNIDSIIQESGVKRLRVISAGKSRETVTEYFTSLRMRDLMSNLLVRYSDRYLFIDAAPIVDSADTNILVELCDYVIMVVPYGKATINRIKEAAKAIGKEKLLGIVFTEKPTAPNFSSIRHSKKTKAL